MDLRSEGSGTGRDVSDISTEQVSDLLSAPSDRLGLKSPFGTPKHRRLCE